MLIELVVHEVLASFFVVLSYEQIKNTNADGLVCCIVIPNLGFNFQGFSHESSGVQASQFLYVSMIK